MREKPPLAHGRERYADLKTRVHQKLLSVLNMDAVKAESRHELRREVQAVLERLLREDHLPVSLPERNRLAEEILDEVFGLGPLEPLLKDPTISDILVNTHKHVYIERHGKLIETGIRFQSDRHLLHIIEKIVSSVGRRIDESVSLVDARLPDGSRVNAIIPPLAVDGPALSIRRFGRKVLTNEELLQNQTVTQPIMTFLAACVEARLNIVISGGTGSGKTTFLNCLSRFIPPHERVITIEDTAELQIQIDDVVRMETRPPNIEGKGAITQRQLLMTALRLRPDRILLGEARAGEALDMLQAMGTGVEGSMTTVHANSPADAFGRLETMVMMAKLDLPSRFIRQQMASVVQLLVQTSRLSDGTRKLTHVSEVVGLSGMQIEVRHIFVFEQTGVTSDGRVQGRFCGSEPSAGLLEKLRVARRACIAGAIQGCSERLLRTDMGNRRLLVFLTLFFGCTVTGWTQKVPEFELFGGYSGLNVDMRQYYHQTPTIYNFRNRYTTLSGAEFSITENKNRHFGGTFDLAFHTRSPNVSGVKNRQRVYTFMYGPRLSTRLGFIKPFAHVLLGAAYEKVEVTPGPHASDLSFAFAPGGGVDLHLGERASIRVLQVDYFRSSNMLVSRPQGFRAAAGFGWSFGALK